MTCELVQSRLTAFIDGELAPDSAAETECHLASCPDCAQIHAETEAVRGMVAAWEQDAPDISARVVQAVSADDQSLLLGEIRLLRQEMEALRAEVAALRRQSRPVEMPWTLPGRFAPEDHPKDYPKMENDPWNLIRS